MIQFIAVSKLYENDYLALDDISFEIETGEFVFLIGPSGSGKTTIIRHLIREENPTKGKIYFDDEDITRYKRNQIYALRRKIGVIFQDYKLIMDKNAFENIAFAMEAAGQNPKDINETVPYVLDIVGLSKKSTAFPEQLSGGEKQRVAIARALANNPKLLIADEPTGNLDPEAAWDIVQILSKINNWGTTVIMSTHGSDIVDTLGKRVIKLEQGKIIKDLLKGTYKSDEVDIQRVKTSIKTAKKKEKEAAVSKKKVESKDNTKKEVKEKKDDIKITFKETKTQDKKQDLETKIEEKQKEKHDTKAKPKGLKIPSISLSNRRKEAGLTIEDFEKNISQILDKKKHKKDKPEKLEPKDDVKSLDLSPKVISILKAYGYDNIEELKNAGFKKISRIDELSTKDLKYLKTIMS